MQKMSSIGASYPRSGVHPQVGLQLAGAELVAGVRVADETLVVLDGDPRVAGEREALHAPVALDVVGRRVGFSDLGDVAGVEQVDDLGQVAARGRSDVAGTALMAPWYAS